MSVNVHPARQMGGSNELHHWKERYASDRNLPGIYTPGLEPGPSIGATVRGGKLRLQLPNSNDLRSHHQQRLDQYRHMMESEQAKPQDERRESPTMWKAPARCASVPLMTHSGQTDQLGRSITVPLPQLMRESVSREKRSFSTVSCT